MHARGRADDVISLPAQAVLASFSDCPYTAVLFTIVIQKIFFQRQNAIIDGPGDIDRELTAQFSEPVLENSPGPTIAFEVFKHIEAGLFLRKILRFH